MNLAWRAAAIIGIGVALTGFGCGKDKQPAEAPSPETSVPLPEWAPENPSPEFLRAASVLKPYAEERVRGRDPMQSARVARLRVIYRATWQLFGTLTDQQIEQFVATRHIRIPVKSLTPDQRGALDELFEADRAASEGDEQDDCLVSLYKSGAKEDLANVDVGFSAGSSHVVTFMFWVEAEGGRMNMGVNMVATL